MSEQRKSSVVPPKNYRSPQFKKKDDPLVQRLIEMTDSMGKLIDSMAAQTEAINNLAASNAMLCDLVASDVDIDDGSPKGAYMDGSPITGLK